MRVSLTLSWVYFLQVDVENWTFSHPDPPSFLLSYPCSFLCYKLEKYFLPDNQLMSQQAPTCI